ncbi:tetratricopeptide repeat protein [Deferribacteres bacterium DY0037]
MPPGSKISIDLKNIIRLSSVIVLALAVVLSLTLSSCSGKESNQQLEENLTEAAPVVSPMLSSNADITKGNEFFLKGEFKEAIDFYENGIAQNRSVAFYNIGVSYYLMGNVKKSEEAFRRSVAEDPTFREALMNLAVVLIQTDKLAEAEKYVEQLLKDDNSAKLLVNMANIHLKRGETAKAAQYFREAMEKGDNSKYVLSNYAYFLMSVGEYKDGIQIIEKLEYKDYTDYYNLAKAYLNINMDKAALDSVERALRINRTEDALSLAADAYHALGDFYNEIKSLDFLIGINPDKEYMFRLARAYYLNGKMTQSQNEIRSLIETYPEIHKYYRLYYEVLIALGYIREAGEMAEDAYNKFKTDNTLYTVVKHKIIYHEDVESIKSRLFVDRTSPYLELGRTAYYIAKDIMLKAREHILNVPPETDNDYYVFRSYILQRYGKYDNALAFAKGINNIRPESFWYRFVAYFNMGDIRGVQELLAEQVARKAEYRKLMRVSFHLVPRIEDIDFSYRFDGSFEDMLTTILYPLFMDPDDMMDFVALGYKMLQEDSKVVALQELERSVEYSEGIKLNNDGVALLLDYKFQQAYNKFEEANKLLNNNPYALYNMGLAKLNLGDVNGAAKYFDTAILQNNYHFPAYLGMAVCFSKKGQMHKAMDYYNLVRDRVEQVAEGKRKIPEPVIYAGFLAEMGFKGYTRVIDAIGDKKDDNSFLAAMVSIAEYMKTGNFEALNPLQEPNTIFRGHALRDLLGTLEGETATFDESIKVDRLYRFMKAYAILKQGAGAPDIKPEEYPDDIMVLKELVYYTILMSDRDKSLEYLQQLSRITIRSTELYKASLYYFMWVEDFVNAEASYTSLDSLNYTDSYVDYYKMLYFMLNYNGRRLISSVKSYMKEYPADIKGKAVRILYSIKEEDFELALNSLNDLKKEDSNFLKSLPLEMTIDGL